MIYTYIYIYIWIYIYINTYTLILWAEAVFHVRHPWWVYVWTHALRSRPKQQHKHAVYFVSVAWHLSSDLNNYWSSPSINLKSSNPSKDDTYVMGIWSTNTASMSRLFARRPRRRDRDSVHTSNFKVHGKHRAWDAAQLIRAGDWNFAWDRWQARQKTIYSQ